MLAVSAAELAAIQAEANSTLDKTCDIWRDSGASTPASATAFGSSTSSPGNTSNYAKVHASVACSVNEPTGTHLQNYDFLIGAEKTWMVRLPVGTDVLERDHLVVGTDTLEVHVLLQPRSYQALLTVLCAEIT